jgi:hypothetical protein
MKLFAVAVLAGTATPAGASPADLELTQLTVRTLANGRPACGNSEGKGGGSMKCSADALTTAEKALLAASQSYQRAQRDEIVIEPRLLANLRPACGNTGGKVDAPADCTAADVRRADAYQREYDKQSQKRQAKISVAYQTLMVATADAVRAEPSIKTRLLLNGRPACGNTMSKQGPPAFCRADEVAVK